MHKTKCRPYHAADAGSSGGGGGIPSLKPNERSGSCQRYMGTVCSEYIGNAYIFVSQGLTQTYIEAKLKSAFKVITNSPQLSKECAKYAIPAVCHSTLPLCDMQTQRPRKVSTYYYRTPLLCSCAHFTKTVL